MDLATLSNEIILLEKQIASIKPLEKHIKDLKDQLVNAMVEHNVKKWETPNGHLVTLVAGKNATQESVEVFKIEKFKEENEELYNHYLVEETKKVSGRKAYIKIKLKEE